MAVHLRKTIRSVSDDGGAICGASGEELTASLLFATCQKCIRCIGPRAGI